MTISCLDLRIGYAIVSSRQRSEAREGFRRILADEKPHPSSCHMMSCFAYATMKSLVVVVGMDMPSNSVVDSTIINPKALTEGKMPLLNTSTKSLDGEAFQIYANLLAEPKPSVA